MNEEVSIDENNEFGVRGLSIKGICDFIDWQIIHCWHKFINGHALWAYKDKEKFKVAGWMTTEQALTAYLNYKP